MTCAVVLMVLAVSCDDGPASKKVFRPGLWKADTDIVVSERSIDNHADDDLATSRAMSGNPHLLAILFDSSTQSVIVFEYVNSAAVKGLPFFTWLYLGYYDAGKHYAFDESNPNQLNFNAMKIQEGAWEIISGHKTYVPYTFEIISTSDNKCIAALTIDGIEYGNVPFTYVDDVKISDFTATTGVPPEYQVVYGTDFEEVVRSETQYVKFVPIAYVQP